MKIEPGDQPGKGKFKAKGNFILGSISDGIDPPAENVHLRVGTFATTIPAGAFEWRKRRFEFEGEIDGVLLEMEIRPNRRHHGDNYKPDHGYL